MPFGKFRGWGVDINPGTGEADLDVLWGEKMPSSPFVEYSLLDAAIDFLT